MSLMIPSSSTNSSSKPQNTNKNDTQLWNIIEKQRDIIQELQKALHEMTAERDCLLVKLKEPTPTSSSSSSFTEETNNTSQHINSNKSPIPPPRSPYRSNTISHTDTQNKIIISPVVPTIIIEKSKCTTTDERHSSLANLYKDQDGDEQHVDINDSNEEKLINIQLKVKSIHKKSFILSIINKKNAREIWKIEKLYTDLPSLDVTLNNNLDFLFSDTLDKHLLLIEEYLANVILSLSNQDDDAKLVYSFIVQKKQKEGYLTKRDGGHVTFKKYYFIMNGSELKYFYIKDGQLFMRSIILVPETRIGKQASRKKKQDENSSFQHAFIILLDSSSTAAMNNHAYKYILCAESDSQREEWIKVLLFSQQCLTSSSSHRVSTKKKPNNPHVIRSNSDTSIHTGKKSNPLTTLPTNRPIRHKLYQRSSMDDKAILRYYESCNQNNQKQHLSTKASADSLPNIVDNEINNTNNNKKKKGSRKSFWSRPKLFSNMDSISFPIVSNNNENLQPSSSYYYAAAAAAVEGYYTSSSSTTTTPMFQIFGVPLEEAVGLSRISENFDLPAIVYRCIEFLEAKDAVHEEGIYRLSGSSVQILNLRQQFCEYGDVDLLALSLHDHQVDVHVVAGLLKMWLRELPVNVLTYELLNDFLVVIDEKEKKTRIQILGQLVSMLPIANYSLLRTLIAHLIHIVHHAEYNKMTLRNVGIVFAPTLSIPSGIFTLLMSEFEYIFWTRGDNIKKQQTTHNKLSASSSSKTNPPPPVHPTTVICPEPTTSADRFKQKYLKQEELRSNRNSVSYKNNVPLSIMSLETVINEDTGRRHMDLVLEQDDIERNEDDEFNVELLYTQH